MTEDWRCRNCKRLAYEHNGSGVYKGRISAATQEHAKLMKSDKTTTCPGYENPKGLR